MQSHARARSKTPEAPASVSIPAPDLETGGEAALQAPEAATGRSGGQATSMAASTGRGRGRIDLRAEGTPTGDPTAAFDTAAAGPGGAVPYKAEMEQSFGEDFTGVRAHTGEAPAMKAMGARAAASGEDVTFADTSPSKEEVAHELTHVVQQRQAGTPPAPQKKAEVSRPGDASEKEADAVARSVAEGDGEGGKITEKPTGQVARDAAPGTTTPDAGAQTAPAAEDTVSQLRKELDGWGSDSARILALLQQANAGEKARILADSGLMEKIRSKLSRADMLTALTSLNAPLRTKLTAAMDGWGCDATTIKSMSATASDAEKADVVKDTALLARLRGELSREDAVSVLASLKAPLKDRLTAALDGWGADGAAIRAMLTTATDPEKAAVLADKPLVERLKGECSREDAIAILVTLNAPLKDRLTTAMDGWGCDGKAIRDMLGTASDADKAAVGTDTALVDRLCSELASPDKESVLDTLFAAATDVAAMEHLFEKRFDFNLHSSGNNDVLNNFMGGSESTFGIEGIRRLYNLFKTLPQSHVERLKYLTCTSNNSGSVASGGSSTANPWVRVSYDETMAGDSDTGGAYTDATDIMRPTNLFDTTVAHELGHQVDSGGTYSWDASFTAISGWQKHARGAPARDAILATVTNPLPATLTPKEAEIAKNAAAKAITNRQSTVGAMAADVVTAYTELGLNLAGQAATPAAAPATPATAASTTPAAPATGTPTATGTTPAAPATGTPTATATTPAAPATPAMEYRSSTDLFNDLKTSNLFLHIEAGHVSKEAWMSEPLANTGGRQVHEAYAWKDFWVSYPTASRATKFSRYQFRDPGEEFAELYATYHCTTPKGSLVPAAHKRWFEGKNLHQDPPS